MNKHVEEILKLSKQEQQEAYAEIGTSLMLNNGNPLPNEQEIELNRRIEMRDSGDLTFSTWVELKERIKNKF